MVAAAAVVRVVVDVSLRLATMTGVVVIVGRSGGGGWPSVCASDRCVHGAGPASSLCFLGVEQRARRLGEWAGLTACGWR
eukprot:COSAG01_NODE_8963_length_2601_cov_1.907274_2_plen_80_part_00